MLSNAQIENTLAILQLAQLLVDIPKQGRKLALVMIAHLVFMKALISTLKKAVRQLLMFVNRTRNA